MCDMIRHDDVMCLCDTCVCIYPIHRKTFLRIPQPLAATPILQATTVPQAAKPKAIPTSDLFLSLLMNNMLYGTE